LTIWLVYKTVYFPRSGHAIVYNTIQ